MYNILIQFKRILRQAIPIVVALLPCVAAADQKLVGAFLDRYCLECHSGADPAAGRDLSQQRPDFTDAANRESWIQLHDRVADGEMPPLDHEDVNDTERRAFLKALSTPLVEAVRTDQQANGRGVVRRLNRVEFETALSDLLCLPLDVQERLPADGKRHGFDTVGMGLHVSSFQMEAYLEVLDDVLDAATVLYEQPKRQQWQLDYRDTNGIMQEYRRTGPFHIVPDGVVFFAPEKHAHLNAVVDHFTIPHSATYRVKVTAYAIRSEKPITLTIRTGGPGHSESDEVPKTLLGHVTTVAGEPQVFEFEQRLHRGQFFRIYPASLPHMRFVPNLKERQKDYQGPGVVVQSVEVDGPIFDTWPPASHTRLWGGVKVETLADAKPNADPNEHLLKPPTQTAKPKLTRVKPNDRKKNGPVGQWYYDPKQEAGGEPIYRRARIPAPLHPTRRLLPGDSKAEATRLLCEFVPVAYRRPVGDDEIQLFVELVHHWIDDGDDFETAMRAGYKAVLTSPGFLYHQASIPAGQASDVLAEASSVGLLPTGRPDEQPPGSARHDSSGNQKSPSGQFLTDHALAERLSFFLWTSIPDAELRELADNGRLSDSAVVRKQVERMLDAPRSDRFVENFLGQWLDLRQLNFTSPDSALYPEHDPVLQWSLAEETHRFFRELLRNDLSVANIIDSDFAILNSRLAEHYRIDGVDDMNFRKVILPADSVRGGVMTQASVLKVTANGTTTSPVVRGAWVLDRIIGKPANPPPPGIPAIEPDIRGATTVREQLAQHRNAESCAACHAKIDPPGVALECFDVIGGWRERYRALNPATADIALTFLPNKPLPIKYLPGPSVDTSDKLASGEQFHDIQQFQALLLRDRDQIARTLIEKLMIYATGSPISFADRGEVEGLINRTRASDHGVRSLLHAVVQSEMFRSK